jgi:hypothetical protein
MELTDGLPEVVDLGLKFLPGQPRVLDVLVVLQPQLVLALRLGLVDLRWACPNFETDVIKIKKPVSLLLFCIFGKKLTNRWRFGHSIKQFMPQK